MGKKALLIYGPFTYVMEVPEFQDQIRIAKPMNVAVLKDYMSEGEFVCLDYGQLVFQPMGFTDGKDILMYRFVREE